jgi:prepilin-type N-terminal cleavage/methylation domain-containing protein
MRGEEMSILRQRGLTLIELTVTLAISFIVVGAVYHAFTSQQKTYSIQDQVAEAQQNARVAMNILMRDLRMAGHGKPEGEVVIAGQKYSHRIDVQKGTESEPSDTIVLVGCFGSPQGYLTKTAGRDDSQISVESTGKDLARIFDSGGSDYIFIGGISKRRVTEAPDSREGIVTLNGALGKRYPTGVLSGSVEPGATQIPLKHTDGLMEGDILILGKERLIVRAVGVSTITIDTDPEEAGNQGIHAGYPAGTSMNPIPIYRLTALEYSIAIDESDPSRSLPFLRRDDKVEGDRKLAENIQELQITPDDQDDQSLYTLRLTARTRVRDPDYRENDGFRRRILESQVRVRN